MLVVISAFALVGFLWKQGEQASKKKHAWETRQLRGLHAVSGFLRFFRGVLNFMVIVAEVFIMKHFKFFFHVPCYIDALAI